MTGDLLYRLRGVMCGDDPVIEEAASHIEKLESGEEEWNRICNSYAARIDKLEAALQAIIDRAEFRMGHNVTDAVCALARKALEGKTNEPHRGDCEG